jgi:hypothetical protein
MQQKSSIRYWNRAGVMPAHSEKSESKNKFPRLVLNLGNGRVSALSSFLQSGFFVADVKVGCSLAEFLTTQLGISPDYIRGHISTIFLDGKPVDDLEAAIVKHGSHLALSSALPGLVGATMRQGGILASLRGSITYSETGTCSGGEGMIHLKLFNLVMDDLGSSFLVKGILVNSSDFRNFLRGHPDLLKEFTGILFNGVPVEATALSEASLYGDCELVRLSVQMADLRG